MSRRGGDEEAARLTREIAARAIRRLDVLEWVILGGAVGVALAGGALVALLVERSLGWGFRATWLVASLLLFGIPGAAALARVREEERRSARRLSRTSGEDDG